MPDCAVVALDIGVLLGLSGFNVQDGNPLFPCPFHQLATYVFGDVVHPDCAGLAPQFDDPVHVADHALVWQGNFDHDAQAFMGKVVQHVQQSKCPPSLNRSAMKSIDQLTFGASGTASASGLSRFNRLRGLIRRFRSTSCR